MTERTPLLSAHRGGGDGIFAPNSLAAMQAAVTLGVDFVEFDVRVTGDNRFVTAHDPEVMIDGRSVPIGSVPAETVMRADPSVIALTEVLSTLKGHCRAHVDLKDVRLECEIADACEAVLGPDGFVLTTLEDSSVEVLRRQRPHLDVGLSLGRSNQGMSRLQTVGLRTREVLPWGRVRRCRPTFLAVNYRLGRRGVLREATKRDLRVLLWTLNSEELIREAQSDKQLWAYTTDYPRLALKMADSQ